MLTRTFRQTRETIGEWLAPLALTSRVGNASVPPSDRTWATDLTRTRKCTSDSGRRYDVDPGAERGDLRSQECDDADRQRNVKRLKKKEAGIVKALKYAGNIERPVRRSHSVSARPKMAAKTRTRIVSSEERAENIFDGTTLKMSGPLTALPATPLSSENTRSTLPTAPPTITPIARMVSSSNGK